MDHQEMSGDDILDDVKAEIRAQGSALVRHDLAEMLLAEADFERTPAPDGSATGFIHVQVRSTETTPGERLDLSSN